MDDYKSEKKKKKRKKKIGQTVEIIRKLSKKVI